ncbi:MAG: hypothetical protein ACTSUV_05395 [Candidatus Ranarchaeia archaeon]
MNEKKQIQKIANKIIKDKPDPVVHFRLVSDVLNTSEDSELYKESKSKLKKSRGVKELTKEQDENGGWGRFHSIDRKSEKKIKTTEFGIDRGLALGLNSKDSVLKKASKYLLNLLKGEIEFPDPPEKNNRWETGKELFISAMLSKIKPFEKKLNEVWEKWAEITSQTFMIGDYVESSEINAHRLLTGASVKDSYLVLHNKYQLALLGSRGTMLPTEIEEALVKWVWNREKGIGYHDVSLNKPLLNISPTNIEHWFSSIEILSNFPSWKKLAGNMIEWIWSEQNEDGYWDFGAKTQNSSYLPLSESWRRPINQKHDWSTRVLSLLEKYYT